MTEDLWGAWITSACAGWRGFPPGTLPNRKLVASIDFDNVLDATPGRVWSFEETVRELRVVEGLLANEAWVGSIVCSLALPWKTDPAFTAPLLTDLDLDTDHPPELIVVHRWFQYPPEPSDETYFFPYPSSDLGEEFSGLNVSYICDFEPLSKHSELQEYNRRVRVSKVVSVPTWN